MMLRGLKKKKPLSPDGQMELMDHLGELRTRLFRCMLYVLSGMVLTYSLFDEMFTLLSYPFAPLLAKLGGKFVYSSLMEPFLLQMQTSFIAGIAVSFPFITYELWGFIAPALLPHERKPIYFLAPFSVLLFLSGVGTAYASLPTAFAWMTSFVPNVQGAVLYQNPQSYILLTVKLLLAFGIAFQLPLVLLFLARVGIINSGLMTKYWRHALVGVSVAAAVLTPSNDPLTMMMMAFPMSGLYVLSIGLVRAFEPKEDGTRSLSLATMLLVALMPVGILAAVGWWLWRSHVLS